jgi:hypothetical protein
VQFFSAGRWVVLEVELGAISGLFGALWTLRCKACLAVVGAYVLFFSYRLPKSSWACSPAVAQLKGRQ